MKNNEVIHLIALYEIAVGVEENVKGAKGYTEHVVKRLPKKAVQLLKRYEAKKRAVAKSMADQIAAEHPEVTKDA